MKRYCKGLPSPQLLDPSQLQPQSGMNGRFLIFSFPLFGWPVIPKKAHWVLAGQGLGAQFSIQYIGDFLETPICCLLLVLASTTFTFSLVVQAVGWLHSPVS